MTCSQWVFVEEAVQAHSRSIHMRVRPIFRWHSIQGLDVSWEDLELYGFVIHPDNLLAGPEEDSEDEVVL